MSRTEEVFIPALKDKKIPILTLDNNWHRLFTQIDTTSEIKRLEGELNELLKKQGKCNSDIKDLKALKKRLMDEIVEQADELNNTKSSKAEKKLEDNKRLVDECNQKIEACEDEMLDLPRLIDKTNYDLMIATMESCYEQIKDNNEEIDEISKWVDQMRTELKKKVVIKQQKLQRNQNFYTYMHNIFGAEVINIFDMKYNVVPLTGNSTKESGKSDSNSKEEKQN